MRVAALVRRPRDAVGAGGGACRGGRRGSGRGRLRRRPRRAGRFPTRRSRSCAPIEGAHIVPRRTATRESGCLDWLRGAADDGLRSDGVACTAISTPGDDMPIVTAETPVEALDELFADAAEDTVVIGHTHHQFDRRVEPCPRRQRRLGRDAVRGRGRRVLGDARGRRAAVPQDVLRRRACDGGGRGERRGRSAAEFVAENMRPRPSREEAIASFEEPARRERARRGRARRQAARPRRRVLRRAREQRSGAVCRRRAAAGRGRARAW